MNDTLVMFYMNDKDAGNAAYPPDPGAVLTDNPMYLYFIDLPNWIEEYDSGIPRQLAFVVAPNPVGNHLSLRYALPQSGRTSIALYSTDGRFVNTVIDAYTQAGSYTEYVSTNELASGTYFMVLKTGLSTITRSVVVMH